jgi:hypothetical protein
MIGVRVDRRNSHDVVAATMGQGWGGRPTGLTARWQDKSREARGGRLAGMRGMIKELAQCAPAHQSLPIRTNRCGCKQKHTSRSERNGTRR